MGRLFGTDGIRAIAGGALTAELALKVGRALGTLLTQNEEKPTVLIGTDTRISGDMLSFAVGSGLMSVGCNVGYLGVISTPAVAYLTKKYGAAGGVVISASHNPYEYNGIKIFGKDGFKLPDAAEDAIEKMIFEEAAFAPYSKGANIGREIAYPDAKADYVAYLSECAGCDATGMRIALDCANGAASVSAAELFTKTGAECLVLGAEPDGVNTNLGCGSTHLEMLCAYVKQHGLDAGFAFDGDADRFLAVDETGNVVDGDFIMAILALDLKKRGLLWRDTVVGTVMTNLGFKKFCEENGIGFAAARVGDRYVLDIMNKEGYAFGGEQSGHIIFRQYATTGDGQLTALALLRHMKESGMKLSELARVMKKYPQHMVNVHANEEQKKKFAEDGMICDVLRAAETEIGDGRILIRASGTEPLIRVMAEGKDEALTIAITERLAKDIERLLCEG